MLVFRRHLPLAALLSGALAATPTAAFEPHPDCRFTPKEVPMVRSCEGLRELYDAWWSRHAGLTDSLQTLQMAMSDPKNTDAFIDALKNVANPLPTDAAGAATWLAGKKWPLLDEIVNKVVNPGLVLYTFVTGIIEGARANELYREISLAAAFARNEMLFYENELRICDAERRKEQAAANRVIYENRKGLPKYPPDHPLCRPPKDTSAPGDDKGDDTVGGAGDADQQTAGGENSGSGVTRQDGNQQGGGAGGAATAVAADSAAVSESATADEASAGTEEVRADTPQGIASPDDRAPLTKDQLQSLSARDLHNLVAEIETATSGCGSAASAPACFRQAASDLDLIVEHLGGENAALDSGGMAHWATQLSTIYKALGDATQ